MDDASADRKNPNHLIDNVTINTFDIGDIANAIQTTVGCDSTPSYSITTP